MYLSMILKYYLQNTKVDFIIQLIVTPKERGPYLESSLKFQY